MKKQLSILWCISALMLCACGNSKPQSKDNIVNKDSLTTNDTKESFIVTKDGVGSLRNNKPFTDMSQNNDALYNKVKKASFYDEPNGITFDSYTLYLDDTEVANFLQETPTSPIQNVIITSPYVSLSNGVKIGMSIRDVLDKEGVTASALYDEIGDTELDAIISVYFADIELNSYYWGKGELTNSGMKKIRTLTMENNSVNLTKYDFKPESKVLGFYLPRE